MLWLYTFIGFVNKDDFPNIVQALGVYVPDSELATLTSTLADFDKPTIIKFAPMFAWFQKVTKEADTAEANAKARDAASGKQRKDDSDDDDDA